MKKCKFCNYGTKDTCDPLKPLYDKKIDLGILGKEYLTTRIKGDDYDNKTYPKIITFLGDYDDAWFAFDINYCPMCGRKLKED